MNKQEINSGSGITWLATKSKLNSMFSELYTAHDKAIYNPSDLDIFDLYLYPIQDEKKLIISTPYGPGTAVDETDQIVHPSLINEPNKWHGYKYWLAYTAFANANTDYENPCIAVSNDLETWTTPDGLTNPVVDKPSGGYNADVHIVLNPDKSKMYMLYRERTTSNSLKIAESTDGVNWSAFASLKVGVAGVKDYACPSMWYDGTQWVIIYHDLDAATHPLERIVCSDDPMTPTDWGSPTTVTIPNDLSGDWWHSEFRTLGNGHIFGMIHDGAILHGGGAPGKLCWAYSTDNGQSFYTALAYNEAVNYKPTFAFSDTNQGFSITLILNKALDADWGLYSTKAYLGKRRLIADDLADRVSCIQGATLGIDGPLAATQFTGPDSVTTLPDTLDGKSWVQGPEEIGVSNNRAFPSSTSNCYATLDLGVSDFTLSTDVLIQGSQWWLHFRRSSAVETFRIGTIGDNDLRLQIYDTSLDMNKIIGGINNGDRLKVEAYGPRLKIYLNALPIYEGEITTHIDNTEIGLQCSGTTLSYFDNILVWK